MAHQAGQNNKSLFMHENDLIREQSPSSSQSSQGKPLDIDMELKSFFCRRNNSHKYGKEYKNRLRKTLKEIQTPAKGETSLLHNAMMKEFQKPDYQKIRFQSARGGKSSSAQLTINEMYATKVYNCLNKTAQGVLGSRARRKLALSQSNYNYRAQTKASDYKYAAHPLLLTDSCIMDDEVDKNLQNCVEQDRIAQTQRRPQTKTDRLTKLSRPDSLRLTDAELLHYDGASDDNIPSFMQDTISSFTSRKIAARQLRKPAYDQRGPDITFKQTKIANPKAFEVGQSDSQRGLSKNFIRDQTSKRQPLSVRHSTIQDASDYISQTLYNTAAPESVEPSKLNCRNNFSQSYAKSDAFSSSFNQMMYQDNSLMAASRTKQRLIQGYRMKQKKAQKEIEKLESIKTRRQIADYYYQHHGIKTPLKHIDNFTEKQLFIKLETKWQAKKEWQAVMKIQQTARMFICRTKYRNFLQLRQDSARRIQRQWKAWHTWSLLPKAIKKHKNNNATMIQKYLRGYLVFQLKYTEIRRKKLKMNFDFFDKKKLVLQNQSQKIIKDIYMKWKEKKDEQNRVSKKKQKQGKKSKNIKKMLGQAAKPAATPLPKPQPLKGKQSVPTVSNIPRKPTPNDAKSGIGSALSSSYGKHTNTGHRNTIVGQTMPRGFSQLQTNDGKRRASNNTNTSDQSHSLPKHASASSQTQSLARWRRKAPTSKRSTPPTRWRKSTEEEEDHHGEDYEL